MYRSQFDRAPPRYSYPPTVSVGRYPVGARSHLHLPNNSVQLLGIVNTPSTGHGRSISSQIPVSTTSGSNRSPGLSSPIHRRALAKIPLHTNIPLNAVCESLNKLKMTVRELVSYLVSSMKPEKSKPSISRLIR